MTYLTTSNGIVFDLEKTNDRSLAKVRGVIHCDWPETPGLDEDPLSYY